MATWLAMFAAAPWAKSVELLSAHDISAVVPAGGNDHSLDSSVSPDGRFVVFSSAASDLVPGDDRQFNSDVFLCDRASNSTIMVSVNLNGTGGGDSHSTFGQVSTNGRYVVFQSAAGDLVTNDVNGAADIFVRDLWTGTTKLVSVATNGGPANAGSSDAVMTPDGRYVAFVSAASNLVPGDNNGLADVFVRDLVSDTTTLASVGAVSATSGAGSARPVITPDGRYVAFFSRAAGLGGSASPNGDVYLRDRLGGTTTWVSTNAKPFLLAYYGPSGSLSNASYHPSLSDDGQYVAFKAGSTNLDGAALILQQDLVTGTTTLISTNGLGAWPNDEDIYGPEMTPDGSLVAYARREPGTVVLFSTPLYSSVHVWNATTDTDILASGNGGGVPTNTISHTPVFSADGRFVAFLSNATNLVGNAVSNGFHIYLRDLSSGTTQLVDADTNGIGSTDIGGTVPSLSADGRFVAFNSPDGRLVSQDNNHAYDVFLRDAVGETNELISQRDPALSPGTGNGLTRFTPYSISADGRWVVFDSLASDLVPNDTNSVSDVFVRDLWTGQIILVSAGANGSPAMDGQSCYGVISANGRYVAYLKAIYNGVTGIGLNHTNANVFRKDLQTGTSVLVSVSTNGLDPAIGDCSDLVISSDGRYVAFQSLALNLAVGTTIAGNAFWRDIDSGFTVRLNGTLPPSLSADGRYVAYGAAAGAANSLKVRDTQTGIDIYTNSAANGQNLNSAALSPDGTRLLFEARSPSVIFAVDVIDHSNLVSFSSRDSTLNSGQWSSDGRFFTFVSSTNALSGGDNNTNKVYLYDLAAGTLNLVSVNYSHTDVANAASDMPMISGDGRFVAYRSYATDIVPLDFNPAPKIFLFDRLTQLNTVLSPAQNDASLYPWISMPALSAGGQNVAFLSIGSSLVAGDLNRGPDAFTIGADSDADGIPDGWMLQHFGHPVGQAGDLSRAADDADGDGRSNLQEYLNGTNPTSATADFTIQMFPVNQAGHTVTLNWPAAPSLSYQVQYKNALSDPQWQDAGGSCSIIANRGYFTVPADQASQYYRVVGAP